MDKIGVFCSAAADLPASYTQAAKDLGTWIGQNHKTLVYGGTWKGLMGVIGMACKEAGGQLYGIYPHYMEGKGFIERAESILIHPGKPVKGRDSVRYGIFLHKSIRDSLPGNPGIHGIYAVLYDGFPLLRCQAARNHIGDGRAHDRHLTV